MIIQASLFLIAWHKPPEVRPDTLSAEIQLILSPFSVVLISDVGSAADTSYNLRNRMLNPRLRRVVVLLRSSSIRALNLTKLLGSSAVIGLVRGLWSL
jgi:hypothetical protein